MNIEDTNTGDFNIEEMSAEDFGFTEEFGLDDQESNRIVEQVLPIFYADKNPPKHLLGKYEVIYVSRIHNRLYGVDKETKDLFYIPCSEWMSAEEYSNFLANGGQENQGLEF